MSETCKDRDAVLRSLINKCFNQSEGYPLEQSDLEWFFEEGYEFCREKLQAENEQLKAELKTWEEMAESHAKAMAILEKDRDELKRKLDLAIERDNL